jgi:putative membrane protein
MANPVDPQKIYAISRPDSSLLTLYFLYSLCSLCLFPLVLIALLIRYYTLRYRFDEEGVRMSVGLLFKHESVVQYSRIQDLHISRGLFQRWLGLATIQVQTASGNAMAEIAIEGLKNYDEIRDFLYSRMRGAKVGDEEKDKPAAGPDEVLNLLTEIRDELRALREKK